MVKRFSALSLSRQKLWVVILSVTVVLVSLSKTLTVIASLKQGVSMGTTNTLGNNLR